MFVLSNGSASASVWQVHAGMSMDDYQDSQEKTVVLGNSGPGTEKYKISLDRKMTVVIAQYNNHFAATYAQKPTHGLITVVY